MQENSRQIFLFGPSGYTQLKSVLGSVLAGIVVAPDDLWLVSPWVSDFETLDNRSGDWDSLDPGWGHRFVFLSEVLATALDAGSSLRLVTNDDTNNDQFVRRLLAHLVDQSQFEWMKFDKLHTKGLLGTSFFIAGSMNFTYSGTNRNDEYVRLSTDAEVISEARLEFLDRYNQ